MGSLHSFTFGLKFSIIRKNSMFHYICQQATWFLFFIFFWRLSYGGKVLVIPLDGSHWLSIQPVMERLQHRGHQVVAVVPDVNLLMKPSDHYIVKTFAVSYSKEYLTTEFQKLGYKSFVHQPFLERITETFAKIRNITTFFLDNCKQLLYNKDLITYLQDSKFNVVVMDPVSPCGQIVAEYLSIPSLFYSRGIPCGLDSEGTMCPNPLSYVPKFYTGNTDHMTFNQRVNNFLLGSFQLMVCYFVYSPFEVLIKEFLHRDMTVLELYSQASIWLLRYDFVFEYPRPIMPNMIFIGGINCAKDNPLTQEFESILEKSGKDGVVVFSLGSMVSEIQNKKAMEIAEGLGTVPQTVLWRYTGEAPINLANNTKLFNWLPQNDLLAHPKTRAFITHAGSHGIYEGICHGVPMVLIPLFGDQADNAVRIVSRGAGIKLDAVKMTSKDLSNALRTVIYDKRYKENIQRLSSLHLDRPVEPLDLAVHWVEFVMKHKGAAHLRPAAHDLNWIQYYSIDVIVLLLAATFLFLFISLKGCLFCCKKCFCKNARLSKRSKSKSQ
ncbi:PREDICTED: UDP-glucuronosyltransferase 1-1-like [Thamnophis sirtalis]|uniref:glucuronosyltransferase n=1 Tax=Thamnophis sirtalis TaxID=35019 RepID=A0A6I9XHA9_9SAUR|nr:PREDICTED: UDP-glucuronosyltransferase 1-1-like [Thamnophis sirtalis]